MNMGKRGRIWLAITVGLLNFWCLLVNPTVLNVIGLTLMIFIVWYEIKLDTQDL